MTTLRKNLVITIVSTVAFAVIIGTYSLYADKLFKESCETFIPSVQLRGVIGTEGWSFFDNISIFSLENGPILIILANQKDRASAFYFVTVYVFQVFLVGYL